MKSLQINPDEFGVASPLYYFPGTPCREGHITVRYVKGHGCAECSKQKARRRVQSGASKEYHREYYHRPHVKEREHARNKEYRRANPDRQRDNLLKHKFGLPVGEYDRMLLAQGGACAICGGQPKRRRLAVDHCHKTGAIRALLCEGCNTALGGVRDNPEILRKAIIYLEKHREGNNGRND